MSDDSGKIVELNVGGTIYLTTAETLKRDENSLIAKLFRDSKSADDSG
uniref:Potassium channel tetramerisation-type BTB domain-containing protein n=1 Tax=Romanomermis culicivorax TaxID=13658 RepID=A0A915KB69_ROMCU